MARNDDDAMSFIVEEEERQSHRPVPSPPADERTPYGHEEALFYCLFISFPVKAAAHPRGFEPLTYGSETFALSS